MEGLVVKVTELNPRLDMEIRDLLADTGRGRPTFEECDLFVRMDDAGRLIGVAYCVAGDEYCHLLDVAVRRESRGEGQGSMIINHLLTHYASACDMMYVVAEEEGFFERFGFERIPHDRLPEEVRRRAEAGGERAHGTAMELELQSQWTRK